MEKYEGHTPGPWRVKDMHGAEGCRPIEFKFRGGGSWNYEELAFTTGLGNDEEDEANARLIADAPMLAERVEELEKEIIQEIAWRNDILERKAMLAEQNERMLAMLDYLVESGGIASEFDRKEVSNLIAEMEAK